MELKNKLNKQIYHSNTAFNYKVLDYFSAQCNDILHLLSAEWTYRRMGQINIFSKTILNTANGRNACNLKNKLPVQQSNHQLTLTHPLSSQRRSTPASPHDLKSQILNTPVPLSHSLLCYHPLIQSTRRLQLLHQLPRKINLNSQTKIILVWTLHIYCGNANNQQPSTPHLADLAGRVDE